MEPRKLILGTYDTHLNGPWTLCAWSLSPAEYQANYVEVPGRNGALDLSTALTDGEPRYNSRTLEARLERSDGTRLEREAAITEMINWLDGWKMDIILPDDELHYITGRVHVAKEFNDPAHAAVIITATVDPWRYNANETAYHFGAEMDLEKTALLTNQGRRTVVPVLEIATPSWAEESAQVLLTVGTASWSLGPGTYQLPDLVVRQGGTEIKYSGRGDLHFRYREAIL